MFKFSNLHRRRRLEDKKWLPNAAFRDRKKNKKDVEQKSQTQSLIQDENPREFNNRPNMQ